MATGGWDPTDAFEDDRYDQHVYNDEPAATTMSTEREWKICAICDRRVEDLVKHYDECFAMQSKDKTKSTEV